MKDKYNKCIEKWNEIFKNDSLNIPDKKESRNNVFDRGVEWLTEDTKVILDFGCGSGTVLFLCSFYETEVHIGIDLSEQAIKNANFRSEKVSKGKYNFVCGGVESLRDIKNASVDAVVLSNIIDNLYPDDTICVLREINRIVRPNGKILIKLNPYLNSDQIEKYKITVIQDNVLDDGMILWNNTTEEWTTIINEYFYIEKYEDIYYKEHEQYNRMFLVKNESVINVNL